LTDWVESAFTGDGLRFSAGPVTEALVLPDGRFSFFSKIQLTAAHRDANGLRITGDSQRIGKA
jgi:hypothetical protein